MEPRFEWVCGRCKPQYPKEEEDNISKMKPAISLISIHFITVKVLFHNTVPPVLSCSVAHSPPWVLHIAKVGYFFPPSLPNIEWLILGLIFFFYQKLKNRKIEKLKNKKICLRT